MCLIETNSRICVDKHLSDMFPVKDVLKLVYALSPFFRLSFRVCHSEGSDKPRWFEIKWYTSAAALC